MLFEDGQTSISFPSRSITSKTSLAIAELDVRETFWRGFRWVVDKDGLSRLLDGIPAPPSTEFHAEDLEAVVRDFWYHAIWTAKKLRRGEVWVAKACCDGYLKSASPRDRMAGSSEVRPRLRYLVPRPISWRSGSTQKLECASAEPSRYMIVIVFGEHSLRLLNCLLF